MIFGGVRRTAPPTTPVARSAHTITTPVSATIASATTHRNASRRILVAVFGVTEKMWINVTRASRIRVAPMRRARRTAHPTSRRA